MCQTCMLGQQNKQEALRLAMGLVLLILLSGIWACLWVPPLVP